MPKHRCPCCGWTIRLGAERPDIVAACSNCTQVVRVPGSPSCAIPLCSTESMIDWGKKGNPHAPDGVPLLPPELCVPQRKGSSPWAYLHVGLLTIAIPIALQLLPGQPDSQLVRLFMACLTGLGLLFGLLLIYHGFLRFRRSSRAQLLSTAQLPRGAERLGIPLALHRYTGISPILFFVVGMLLVAGAVAAVMLRLRGDIEDDRMFLIAFFGLMFSALAFRSAFINRDMRLLVCRDGFVVLHGQENGEIWRWEDIEKIYIQKSSNVPVLFSYTLHRNDGEIFTFDHHIEHFENQFGVRVQQILCRLLLPHLRCGVRAGGQAVFDPIRASNAGLHYEGGFVAWERVANITLDCDQLTISKWGADRGAAWSVPYPAIPNLAVFFALAQQLLRERRNEGQSLMRESAAGCLDSTAIQAGSSGFQSASPLTELHSNCLRRQSGLQ